MKNKVNIQSNIFCVKDLNTKQMNLFTWFLDQRLSGLSGADEQFWKNWNKFLKDNFINQNNRSFMQLVKDEYDLTPLMLEQMSRPFLIVHNVMYGDDDEN